MKMNGSKSPEPASRSERARHRHLMVGQQVGAVGDRPRDLLWVYVIYYAAPLRELTPDRSFSAVVRRRDPGPVRRPAGPAAVPSLGRGAGRAARAGPRIRALDVATGPGTVARILARLIGGRGQVAASDLSPSMIARAESKEPVPNGAPIAYTVAPAAPLPYPTGTFQAVACQQSLQYFPDGLAALTEMHRVLEPGDDWR